MSSWDSGAGSTRDANREFGGEEHFRGIRTPGDPRTGVSPLTPSEKTPGVQEAFAHPQHVNDFHNFDDVDISKLAHHHTLGYRPGQAAPGDEVLKRFLTDEALMLPGAWQAVAYGANIDSWNHANSTTQFFDPGCRLEQGGTVVRLKGLITTTAIIAANATIFTLPVGYRPPRQLGLSINTGGNTVYRIDIPTTGVVFNATGGNIPSGAALFFDGVTFPLSN